MQQHDSRKILTQFLLSQNVILQYYACTPHIIQIIQHKKKWFTRLWSTKHADALSSCLEAPSHKRISYKIPNVHKRRWKCPLPPFEMMSIAFEFIPDFMVRNDIKHWRGRHTYSYTDGSETLQILFNLLLHYTYLPLFFQDICSWSTR